MGTWTEERIADHLCDVLEPSNPSPQGDVILYLHGVHLARLPQNEVYTRLFDEAGLRVVAPFTQRSWWTDKICAEFDPQVSAEQFVLRHVLPFIAGRWSNPAARIALLGTSMGGQGALRLGFKHPGKFPIVAALAPAIDYHQRFRDPEEETLPLMYPDSEAARQDTATLHVHPLNWPRHMWFASDPEDHRWHESSQRLAMKLSALGIPFESDLETSAGGHGWTYYNHMAPRVLSFITERLERERLRV